MGKQKLVCSVSSGLSSALMAYMVNSLMGDQYEIVNIMANSTKERPESLEFAQQIDEYFGLDLVLVEAVIDPRKGHGTRHRRVDFNSCDRDGGVFELGIQKYGIPSKHNKWCTRELKLRPIESYVRRELGWKNYYTAVGIRADEIDRISEEKDKLKLIYPLIEWGVTSKERNLFWESMPFTLELKAYEGNCDVCFEKTLRKLLTIAKDTPELMDWWVEMDAKYGRKQYPGKAKYNEVLESRGRVSFFREHLTAQEILNMSKTEEFEPFRDEYTSYDPKLDEGGGCDSGCFLF